MVKSSKRQTSRVTGFNIPGSLEDVGPPDWFADVADTSFAPARFPSGSSQKGSPRSTHTSPSASLHTLLANEAATCPTDVTFFRRSVNNLRMIVTFPGHSPLSSHHKAYNFKARNPLWGIDKVNDKSTYLNVYCLKKKCYFISDSNTYLYPGNDSYSAVDLTMADLSLLPVFVESKVWSCGGGYFPIVQEHFTYNSVERVARWKFDKAGWVALEFFYKVDFNATEHPLMKFNELMFTAHLIEPYLKPR